MDKIDVGAVLVAAVSSFLLGGLWYSPILFGRLWSREAGIGDARQAGHPAKVFGISFVLAVIAAGAFAMWLGPRPLLKDAVQQGFLVGACLVATSFGINYQFSNRTPLLWAIDGGYHTAQFVLYGVVLGVMT